MNNNTMEAHCQVCNKLYRLSSAYYITRKRFIKEAARDGWRTTGAFLCPACRKELMEE